MPTFATPPEQKLTAMDAAKAVALEWAQGEINALLKAQGSSSFGDAFDTMAALFFGLNRNVPLMGPSGEIFVAKRFTLEWLGPSVVVKPVPTGTSKPLPVRLVGRDQFKDLALISAVVNGVVEQPDLVSRDGLALAYVQTFLGFGLGDVIALKTVNRPFVLDTVKVVSQSGTGGLQPSLWLSGPSFLGSRLVSASIPLLFPPILRLS